MESQRRRSNVQLTRWLLRCLALAAVLLGVGAHASAAHAQQSDDGAYRSHPFIGKATIEVVSAPSGVTIYIATTVVTPGTSSPGETTVSQSGSGGPSCSANPMNIGNSSTDWVRQGSAEHPGATPWMVQCDDGNVGVAWVPANSSDQPAVVLGNPPGAGVDPSQIAASVFEIVPLPPVTVGVNPGTGLVAVSSWFWIDGYDGSTLRGSRTLDSVAVEVEITPSGYLWAFGDGSTLETTSVGRAYPDESDIQHHYEQSSLSAGGAFTVKLDITFSARYRVNDGPWQALPPVVQSFDRAYPVQQLQSVLTRG